MRIRKPAIITAAVATAACFAIPVLSGSAQASSSFQISSDSSPFYCMQENGTSTPLYLDPCGSNNSNFWRPYSTDADEFQNVHSNLCITYEGTGARVDLQACHSGAATQEWIRVPEGNNGTSPPDVICLGISTGICLWQSVKTVQARAAVDPGSVHDLWNF